MSINKDNSYEDRILQCLNLNNYGLTVAGIAKKLKASRNTIYRYLGVLEVKKLVFRKEIGRYNLYFSKEGRQVSKEVVASFYKGLLIALNNENSLNLDKFKNIGKIISNHVVLPFENDDFSTVIKIETPLKKELIKILEVIHPYMNLLHDKISLKDIVIDEEKNKITIEFINSDMLEEHEAGISHFYILTGFIEAKIKSRFGLNVSCDIIEYEFSTENEENFIKISLELL